MGILPLSIAMMASQISAITMLGMSGEAYIRGLFVMLLYTNGIFVVPLIAVLYLPVYFELKVVSIYEVNRRTEKRSRSITCHSVYKQLDTTLFLNRETRFLP